jgi:hypothetical protein
MKLQDVYNSPVQCNTETAIKKSYSQAEKIASEGENKERIMISLCF